MLPTLVLAAAASCAAPAPPRIDLLLLTVDTLRGDRWGCLGDPAARTPEMDRLARGGLLAFEGRAPAPLTLPSHVSLMTGLPPAVHGVRDNGIFALPSEGPPTVAERLQERGWQTAAFVSAFPLARRFGLDRGFDRYDEYLGAEEDEGYGHLRERTAAETVDRVERWFTRWSPDPERPAFLWVHFFDPHAEYRAPPPWAALYPDAPYDAEVAFTDHEAGRLLDRLEERRPDRDRRVIVASDHGEGLGESGEATHGVLLHAATIRVPILVWGGGVAPRLIPTPVPLESIARTALALAREDVELDPAAAPPVGEFAGPVLAETLYPAFNFGWRGLRAREEAGWKLVSGETDRLYRVAADPGEARDVAGQYPDVAASLRDALEEEWPSAGPFAAVAGRATSPDEGEALRSLGYLGGGAGGLGRIDVAFDTGPDPADRIGTLDDVNGGISLLDSGDAAAAERVLASVVEIDPGNRLALEYLGRAQMVRGHLADARRTLNRALALGPNPTTVYLDLSRVERELGNPDAAWTALERALEVDPRSALARQDMAAILVGRGDFVGGARILEEAVEIRPRSAPLRLSLARVYAAAGRSAEAAAAWKEAADLDPDGPVGAAARADLARHPGGGAP